MLLQQIYRPMNATAMTKTLNLIDRLFRRVKLYRLGCNMNIEAAQVAYLVYATEGLCAENLLSENRNAPDGRQRYPMTSLAALMFAVS